MGAGLSHVYPLGSRINEQGRLEIGGCDVIELAERYGTPAYVYAEDDLRARARAYVDAFKAHTDRFEVVYASKAFPCTAAYRLLAAEGIACDVASGGELFLALRGGFAPESIYFHGNNKSEAELRQAHRGAAWARSSSTRSTSSSGSSGSRRASGIMLRVTPGITPTTHSYITTGQVDSKFGFGLDDVPRAIESVGRLELRGLHAHLGSQIFDLEPFEQLAEVLTRIGDYPLLNLGGGLGIAYTRDQLPPSIEEYVETLVRSAPDGVTVLCEPGRSLVGNAGVTIYRVGTVKRIPGVRTYVAVDGGMSDNLRPMLYGAQYEAEIADRFGGEDVCTIAGKHCESGDVLVARREARRPAARRRAGHARHRRVRPRDGQQLQRHPAAARDLLPGRRGAGGGAARDATRTWRRVTFRVGLLGHGTVGSAFAGADRVARGGDRGDHRAAARDQRRAHALARRLRRHRRAQRPGRRADRRRRARARLHPARAARGQARGHREQGRPLAARRGDLRRRARGRGAAALRGRGRRGGAGHPRDPRDARGRARRPRPRDRQRHHQLHPHRDDPRPARPTRRRSPRPSGWATRRPTRPRT